MLSLQFLIIPRPTQPAVPDVGPIETLMRVLRRDGHVARSACREEAHAEWLAGSDVVLLEVNDMADLSYCALLRQHSCKPLLLYGWDVPTSTWIKGLQLGADAFLSMPEEEEILRARLMALLRRSGLYNANARRGAHAPAQ